MASPSTPPVQSELAIPESRPRERNGYTDEDDDDVDGDINHYECSTIKLDLDKEEAVLLALAPSGRYISRKEPDSNGRNDYQKDHVRDSMHRHLDFSRPFQRIPLGITTGERVPNIDWY